MVTGPGVSTGATVPALASGVDLAPTFLRLAGVAVPADMEGRSLASWLGGVGPATWRSAAYVERLTPVATYYSLPVYRALRTESETYVEYANGDREYYDMSTDPAQMHNVFPTLPADRQLALHLQLEALAGCSDGASCRGADRFQ